MEILEKVKVSRKKRKIKHLQSITTKCEDLDDILGGGVAYGEVTEVCTL